MKNSEKIILICICIGFFPLAAVFVNIMLLFIGAGIFGNGLELSNGEQRQLIVLLLVLLNILVSIFCSIPIWVIDYKSKKTRMIRQGIVIVLYAVALTLNWFRMVTSY